MALVNSDDYSARLDTILANKPKFLKINTDEQEIHSIIVKKNSINYYVRKYLKGYGDQIISLIPPGSNPGKLYALMKVHKLGNPARPGFHDRKWEFLTTSTKLLTFLTVSTSKSWRTGTRSVNLTAYSVPAVTSVSTIASIPHHRTS